MRMERKSWAEFKAVAGGAGGFTGYASLWGVRDAGGDIVERGAFADTLPQFIERGFIAAGHDWAAPPIGYITRAVEDDRGLAIEVAYHSTPAAQAARTVAQERMAAGKSVGLSIGYAVSPGGMYMAADGARHLTKLELYETSQVNVPMLRPAGLTAVKADGGTGTGAGAGDDPAGGPAYDVGERVVITVPPHMAGQAAGTVREAVLTYAYGIVFDSMEAAGIHHWYVESELAPETGAPGAPGAADQGMPGMASAALLVERGLAGLTVAGAKSGRVLSASNHARLTALAGTMRTALADLDELLASTDAEASTNQEPKGIDALLIRHLALRAQRLGAIGGIA